jgi:hypothetical protein
MQMYCQMFKNVKLSVKNIEYSTLISQLRLYQEMQI